MSSDTEITGTWMERATRSAVRWRVRLRRGHVGVGDEVDVGPGDWPAGHSFRSPLCKALESLLLSFLLDARQLFGRGLIEFVIEDAQRLLHHLCLTLHKN